MTETAPQSGTAWAQTPLPAPPSGPVGKPTAPGNQILLTIVTLGIWAYVWTYRQHRDIQEYSGEGVGGAVGLVIIIVAGVATPFLLSNEIETKLYGKAGQVSPLKTVDGVWALIPLVGGILWYLKAQKALNEFWMQRGATL
jgi:hypothetical protein